MDQVQLRLFWRARRRRMAKYYNRRLQKPYTEWQQFILSRNYRRPWTTMGEIPPWIENAWYRLKASRYERGPGYLAYRSLCEVSRILKYYAVKDPEEVPFKTLADMSSTKKRHYKAWVDACAFVTMPRRMNYKCIVGLKEAVLTRLFKKFEVNEPPDGWEIHDDEGIDHEEQSHEIDATFIRWFHELAEEES